MQGRNPNPRRIDPPFIGTGKTKLLKNPICKLHPELVKKQVLGVFRYGIYPVEGIGVFRVPKNGDARNKKPPALRVETKRCTKKSPFRYNRVVQALL